MTHPVVFFEIVGQDGQALRRFYGDLFAWTIQPPTELPGGGVIAVLADPEGHEAYAKGFGAAIGLVVAALAVTVLAIRQRDVSTWTCATPYRLHRPDNRRAVTVET